jgi:hypothetical protein
MKQPNMKPVVAPDVNNHSTLLDAQVARRKLRHFEDEFPAERRKAAWWLALRWHGFMARRRALSKRRQP